MYLLVTVHIVCMYTCHVADVFYLFTIVFSFFDYMQYYTYAFSTFEAHLRPFVGVSYQPILGALSSIKILSLT